MPGHGAGDPAEVQLITFNHRDPDQSMERNGYKNGKHGDSQREKFLPEPVKLDPGWDSMGKETPEAHTDTSGLIREMEQNPPFDRGQLVYLLMMIHGIALLTPWNMFINAKSYFEDYKLDAGNSSSEALLDYKTNFMSYIGMASQYPNFFMNIINIFVQCGGDTLGARILVSIAVTVVMFIATVVLAIVDSSEWAESFFWLTMITAVIINACMGVYQNSMYGLVSLLPMRYTNAVIFGNNISGTLVAITSIIMISVAGNERTSAIYYFVTAIVILLIAFDSYFIAKHCKFYRHYTRLGELKQLEVTEKHSNLVVQPFHVMLRKSFGRIFKQIWHLMFGVWFTFFISLALFPAVMSDVRPVSIQMSSDEVLNVKYWINITCFLCFNLCATLGNLTTEFIKFPNAKWLNVLIVARVVFVPLMVLGNFRNDDLRTLPVFFDNDYVFIASGVLMAFTSGYCSSLAMMYAPKLVDPGDAPIAGMSMAIFLVFGILCGINFSRVWGFLIYL